LRRCGTCGEDGHDRRTCGRAGRPARKIEQARQRATPIATFAPATVQAGQRYIVAEDHEEGWRVDDTWEVVELLGELDGYEYCVMRNDRDGAVHSGHPQLWPFIRETPGQLPPVVSLRSRYMRDEDEPPQSVARRERRRAGAAAVGSALP
jgi:hypothetical protein